MLDVNKFKSEDGRYCLTKIMGQNIKEIHGRVSNSFDIPCFKLIKVELEDGTMIDCEGEPENKST